MLHHIIKEIEEKCPYCGAELVKKEHIVYFKSHYTLLTFECGKKILKRSSIIKTGRHIKKLEDY